MTMFGSRAWERPAVSRIVAAAAKMRARRVTREPPESGFERAEGILNSGQPLCSHKPPRRARARPAGRWYHGKSDFSTTPAPSNLPRLPLAHTAMKHLLAI